MYYTVSVSWWLTLPLAALAAGFLVRIFIIFHDCGHGSFFKSKAANDWMGIFCGFLTFTPYYHWRWEHAQHHATSGDLDRRGVGDIWTMTAQEYLEAPFRKRMAYRTVRHPFVLMVLAPFYLFLVQHRFAKPKARKKERWSVYGLNLAILVFAVLMSIVFGLKEYLIIQFTISMIAGSAGVWLFYVQHQFEGASWERNGAWDYATAALIGSSYYKLPKILQWFSGNIGFHHVHHLSPKIPNYYLQKCHLSDPVFSAVNPVTFLSSFRLLSLKCWDEEQRKLVGFRELKRMRRSGSKARVSS